MKNNLEDEIEAYYINESKKIPQLSDGQKNILKERIYDNKHKRKSFIKKQFAIIASLLIVILIPSILIPVLNNNQVKYYSDTDIIQENLEYDYVYDYINQNFNQYMFIFEECDVSYTYGVYSTEDHDLLSINIELFMYVEPFPTIKLDFIINKGLTLYKYENVLLDSETKTDTSCTIHIKENSNSYDSRLTSLIEFDSFNLYLVISPSSNEILNKFIIA